MVHAPTSDVACEQRHDGLYLADSCRREGRGDTATMLWQ